MEKKLVHILDYEDENVNPLFDTDLIFKGTAKWEANVFKLISSKAEILGTIEYQEIDNTKLKLKKYKISEPQISKVSEPDVEYKLK